VPIVLSDDIATVDWERLVVVFEQAPLGKREPEKLRQLFQNSNVRCFAFDSGLLIGAGRALTDWMNHAVIFDVVLLPEYQGQGIGRRIMSFLAEYSKAKNVMLHAAPGREGFYEKLGYRKMKTAMALFANEGKARESGYIE
jgi:Acetyltransferase (GNAT) family.